MTTNPPAVDINLRVQQYVKLRDTIKEQDDAHKEKMRPYREALEQLSGILMTHLQAINANNVSTKAGTVYKTVKNSATIEDASAFWDYVRENESWDLIDKRANVTAVADFLQENNVLPPGVKYSSVAVVGVRRK